MISVLIDDGIGIFKIVDVIRCFIDIMPCLGGRLGVTHNASCTEKVMKAKIEGL